MVQPFDILHEHLCNPMQKHRFKNFFTISVIDFRGNTIYSDLDMVELNEINVNNNN